MTDNEDLSELEGPNPKGKDVIAQPINMMQNIQPGDIEANIRMAEKHIELQDTMRKLALKATNKNDWVDQNGIPYLEASGAKKIRMIFGCDILNVMYEKTVFVENEEHPYYVIDVVGDISWNGQTVAETGTCSSKDPFFAKRKGKLLPMSEVDITNIRKKALTNFWNRAIKSLLGLSFTWEEIEDYTDGRVTRVICQGVNYNHGSKGGKKPAATPDQEKKRTAIKQMMGEMYGKDEAPNKLEKNTTFQGDNGTVKGKRNPSDLTPAQIDRVYNGIKPAYDKWVKDKGAKAPEAPKKEAKKDPKDDGLVGESGRTRADLSPEEQKEYDKAPKAKRQEILDLPF